MLDKKTLMCKYCFNDLYKKHLENLIKAEKENELPPM